MDIKWLWLRALPKKVFIWRGNTGERKVALTFDDSPTRDTTEDILQALKKQNATATFFLTGSRVEENPDLLLKIHSGGHEIGNHSYNHVALNKISLKEIMEELNRTQEAIKRYTGSTPRLFRPPYGALNFKVILAAVKCNLTTVLWTVDPKDFSLKEPSEVIERLRPHSINGGEIILLHDGVYATLKALPDIIKSLQKKGITMTTIMKVV